VRHRSARGLSFPAGVLALAVVASLFACSRHEPSAYQGYVEGEYVHVASGVGGRLEKMLVARGQVIEADTPLFELEAVREGAEVRQAEEALSAAGAQLADLGTGRRHQEIDVTEAQLEQARAAERQSMSQLERDQAQFDAGGISKAQLEESRARHDVDTARVKELQSQVEVARLSARPAQIQAQSSEVAAAQAARDQAKWRLDEKHVAATKAGLVVDTLFREGEWVPAGAPVVRMLPPGNVKVRFFVPEAHVGRFALGTKVTLRCAGCPADLAAEVSYIAPDPEFTPPVIYSNDMREKLVFMLEARPAADSAARLRPGQPVEVAPR
jgi:HlyD family secretion protein